MQSFLLSDKTTDVLLKEIMNNILTINSKNRITKQNIKLQQ